MVWAPVVAIMVMVTPLALAAATPAAPGVVTLGAAAAAATPAATAAMLGPAMARHAPSTFC
jgi:hypothetical protein